MAAVILQRQPRLLPLTPSPGNMLCLSVLTWHWGPRPGAAPGFQGSELRSVRGTMASLRTLSRQGFGRNHHHVSILDICVHFIYMSCLSMILTFL